MKEVTLKLNLLCFPLDEITSFTFLIAIKGLSQQKTTFLSIFHSFDSSAKETNLCSESFSQRVIYQMSKLQNICSTQGKHMGIVTITQYTQ